MTYDLFKKIYIEFNFNFNRFILLIVKNLFITSKIFMLII
jgi:hypothetical protein